MSNNGQLTCILEFMTKMTFAWMILITILLIDRYIYAIFHANLNNTNYAYFYNLLT